MPHPIAVAWFAELIIEYFKLIKRQTIAIPVPNAFAAASFTAKRFARNAPAGGAFSRLPIRYRLIRGGQALTGSGDHRFYASDLHNIVPKPNIAISHALPASDASFLHRIFQSGHHCTTNNGMTDIRSCISGMAAIAFTL